MTHRLLFVTTLVFLLMGSSAANAQAYTDLALGSQHFCALTDTQDVKCNTSGHAQRYAPPDDLSKMVAITAGSQHTCGINLNAKAVCWGDESFGSFDELNVPAITRPLVSIAAGAHHTCAIDVDSRVWCWGLDTNEQAQPPGDGLGVNGAGFIKVDGGVNFSCGIETGGDIACWTTDGRFANASNIAGPFIDLDVSPSNACGLSAEGNIECWVRRFAPPSNGPYSDLMVSRDAICGLNQTQTIDCTFSASYNPTLPILPTDESYVSIFSGSQVFLNSLPFCGLTVTGAIKCADNLSQLIQFDDSAETANPLGAVQLPIYADFYSTNSIELFWTNPPLRYGTERILIEVYRNDVLIDTTTNATSWYDSSEQTHNPAEYKIRPIDLMGNIGPFSSTVSIDTVTGEVTRGEASTSFDFVEPMHTVDSVILQRLGNTYILVWSGSVPGTNGLKGYEVRLNNEIVAFNDGFSHTLESYNNQKCNLISVAAMSEDGTMFDYKTIVRSRFSRDYSSCSQTVFNQ